MEDCAVAAAQGDGGSDAMRVAIGLDALIIAVSGCRRVSGAPPKGAMAPI